MNNLPSLVKTHLPLWTIMKAVYMQLIQYKRSQYLKPKLYPRSISVSWVKTQARLIYKLERAVLWMINSTLISLLFLRNSCHLKWTFHMPRQMQRIQLLAKAVGSSLTWELNNNNSRERIQMPIKEEAHLYREDQDLSLYLIWMIPKFKRIPHISILIAIINLHHLQVLISFPCKQ